MGHHRWYVIHPFTCKCWLHDAHIDPPYNSQRIHLNWQEGAIHYSDIIMSTTASQITSLTIVYSTVYSGADQRKHQKFCVTNLCAGNSPITGEFPAHKASNAENVSIWWRHHVMLQNASSQPNIITNNIQSSLFYILLFLSFWNIKLYFYIICLHWDAGVPEILFHVKRGDIYPSPSIPWLSMPSL